MKILFFSVTNHQKKYFEKLQNNLSIMSHNVHYPSLKLFTRYFRRITKINVNDILIEKYKEIDAKYRYYFHRILYKMFIRVQTPLVLSVCINCVEKYNPTHVALWNGKKFYQRLMLRVAEQYDIKSIFFENGSLPDTTTMDFVGVNASNSLPRNINFYKNVTMLGAKQLPRKLVPRKVKYASKHPEKPLPKRYIFIPFQVGYDTQILQHSPWIRDMYMFFEILEEISEKVDVCFVIKEHPSDSVNNYESLYRRETDKIIFTSMDTQALIEGADVIISINSSVAIESLLFHKRVIVLGEAFFTIEGIVKVSGSVEGIVKILLELDQWLIDKEAVDIFLKYLYFEYLIPGDWHNPTLEHYQKIEKKLKKDIFVSLVNTSKTGDY